jgi:hypothetical protein
MKNLAKKNVLNLIIVCCLISVSASAAPYKPRIITDVATVEYTKEDLRLDDRSVDLSISYQASSNQIINNLYISYSPDYIRSFIRSSWLVMKDYLRSQNIPTNDCRDNYNINMFVMNNDILFDPARYDSYFKKPHNKSWGAYGFYDSTLERERDSAILVTDVNAYQNNITMSHELGHYWWDRLCLGRHWTGSPENFARSFHSYYESRELRK